MPPPIELKSISSVQSKSEGFFVVLTNWIKIQFVIRHGRTEKRLKSSKTDGIGQKSSS
jgi:hypothetical protein